MGLIFLIVLLVASVKENERQERKATQERLDKFKKEISEERKKFWDYYNETGRILIQDYRLEKRD